MINFPRVWDGTSYAKRLHPISCSVSLTLTPPATASMTLPPMDEVSVLDMVEIELPDSTKQYFRVSSIKTDEVTGEQSVELEHGACTLEDNMLVTDVKKTDTITNILTYLLSFQSRWTLGTVEATETIFLNLGGSTILSAITSIMQYIPAYQLEFTQASASTWTVNVKQRPQTAVCECRLGRNTGKCEISYDASGICTRVYADGLTGGKMDSTSISLYGVHDQKQSLDKSLSKAQKEAIVSAYLAAHDHPAVSISITASELSQVTGLSIDHFTVGAVCRVTIPEQGVTVNEVITQKQYSDIYTDPENVTLTLANATPDLAISVASIARNGSGTSNNVRKNNDRWEVMVQNIGDDNEQITAASICLAINSDGSSSARIEADHIILKGTQITVDGLLYYDQAYGKTCDVDWLSAGNAETQSLTVGENGMIVYSLAQFLSEVQLTGVVSITGGDNKPFTVGSPTTFNKPVTLTSTFTVGSNAATWKSKTVVTGIVNGVPTTETINYLGR